MVGKANRLPDLSLGMESEGERMRGSREGLLLVLAWNLRHVLLAIQLSHRQMSFQLVLLIRTSVQHSAWKMDKILVLAEVGLEEGLDKAREGKEVLEDVGALVAMEEPAQVVASKEEMEAAEVGEETEEVVGMEEEVERVLSEELEVLVVLAVLVLTPIVPGTDLVVVMGGRLVDVARAGKPRRKVGQERLKSQWLVAAGGQLPSG